MKKIFSFLLLGLLLSVGNVWAEADQVTLAYTSNTTTNMTGNNDAALVGLDANHWSVTGGKGGHASFPGLNGNNHDVRLYYNANGSNTLTVENLYGAIINSITVDYVTNYENGKVLVNSQEVTGNNSTYAINSSSFVITNGNTSNTQVRFTSIQINYTPAASNVPVIYGAPSSLDWLTVLKDASVDAKTFNLSGANLTGAITLAATGGYTVSPASITPINGDIAATEITITPPTTATAGTKNGTITISGGGLAQSSVINLSMIVEEPLTVAAARNLIDGGTGLSSRYVAGIISQVDSYSSNQITYWISDDGTTTNQLEVYKGKNLNNTNFTSKNDLKVGDIVIVFGNLTLFNTTYEFSAGNYLVYLERPVVASIDVVPNSIEAVDAGAAGTIEVTYNNITTVVAEVYFCDAQGDAATYDWVAAEINAQNNVDYIIEANSGAARTAYMKVHALDNNAHDVYSELITISQAEHFEIVDGVFDFVAAGNVGEDYGSGVPFSTSAYVTTEKTWTAVNVTMVTGKKSGNGYRWWDADKTLRFYSGAYASFSVPAGYLITKIVTTGANFDNADSGTLSSSTWTGSAEEVTLSVTSTRNIKTITITYIDATPTLGANGWSTFSAPFKFAVTGAEVYMAAPDAEQNATKVILSKVENGIVPAEEGVILKGTEGATVTITPTNAEASDYDDNLNDLMNTAVAPAIASEGSNMYVLATIGGTTAFYPCGNITIPMNKAWMFIFPAANQAPDAIRIEFAENSATNIQNVEGAEKAVKFIENGKLFILREGVVYDATGRMVK